jgi:hypothetical protein
VDRDERHETLALVEANHQVHSSKMTGPLPPLPEEIRDFLDEWNAEIKSRDVYRDQEWRLLTQWYEMRERMDYWMTGLAGAVLAYAVQSYDSGLVPNLRILAPVSWALLLAALGCGVRGLALLQGSTMSRLRRTIGERTLRSGLASIERTVLWQRHDIAKPVNQTPEERAELERLEPETRERFEQLIALGKEAESGGQQEASMLELRAARFARWRTRLLLLGFGTLAILRLINLNQ